MKYENFEQAVKVVSEIQSRQMTLDALNSFRVTVIVNEHEQNGRIMTIGANEHYEHPYTDLAVEFICKIKQDIQMRIGALMNELELL